MQIMTFKIYGNMTCVSLNVNFISEVIQCNGGRARIIMSNGKSYEVLAYFADVVNNLVNC